MFMIKTHFIILLLSSFISFRTFASGWNKTHLSALIKSLQCKSYHLIFHYTKEYLCDRCKHFLQDGVGLSSPTQLRLDLKEGGTWTSDTPAGGDKQVLSIRTELKWFTFPTNLDSTYVKCFTLNRFVLIYFSSCQTHRDWKQINIIKQHLTTYSTVQ